MKPKPYRIICSVWNPGKFVVKRWTGHKNLPIEIQYKLVTPVRFDSIAGACRFIQGLGHGAPPWGTSS